MTTEGNPAPAADHGPKLKPVTRLYELGSRGTRVPLDWPTLHARNQAYWDAYEAVNTCAHDYTWVMTALEPPYTDSRQLAYLLCAKCGDMIKQEVGS